MLDRFERFFDVSEKKLEVKRCKTISIGMEMILVLVVTTEKIEGYKVVEVKEVDGSELSFI